MNFYVLKPDIKPYKAMKVDKDTEFTFENEKVSQELKDLELKTFRLVNEERYSTKIESTIHLNEGDVILLDEENIGWFLPGEPVETIEDAIRDYKIIAEVLDGDENVIKGNEGESI